MYKQAKTNSYNGFFALLRMTFWGHSEGA